MKKKLKIALIINHGKEWIAGSYYLKNIIFALRTLDQNIQDTFEICLIYNQLVDKSFYEDIISKVDHIYESPVKLNAYNYTEMPVNKLTLAERIKKKINRSILKQPNPLFNAFLAEKNIDFVYSYCNPTPAKNVTYKCAVWIFDFQHKYLPQFFSEKYIEKRDNSFLTVAKYSPMVVLSSKAAESDFQKFFPEYAHKSRVLPFKTLPDPQWYEPNPQDTREKYCLPDKFFLISNQFWIHKNHLTVFEALNILKKKSIHPILVCTGSLYEYRQPDYSNKILQTIHQLGIAHQVYLLGLVPRIDQIQLIRGCMAVIQPSLFEGWSTVVEEVKTLGKPMILSDLPANIEQSPPDTEYFKQKSPEDLAEKMAMFWEKLSSGVNFEREKTARENNLKEVQEFGLRFLKIAKDEG